MPRRKEPKCFQCDKPGADLHPECRAEWERGHGVVLEGSHSEAPTDVPKLSQAYDGSYTLTIDVTLTIRAANADQLGQAQRLFRDDGTLDMKRLKELL